MIVDTINSFKIAPAIAGTQLRSQSAFEGLLDAASHKDAPPPPQHRTLNQAAIATAASTVGTLPASLSDSQAASAPADQHERLTVEARRWVAMTFYGQMLKLARQSPFKSDLFSGGRGGEAFGGLLDGKLAEHMSRAAGEKLVKSLVKRMEARAATSHSTDAQAMSARSMDDPTTGGRFVVGRPAGSEAA